MHLLKVRAVLRSMNLKVLFSTPSYLKTQIKQSLGVVVGDLHKCTELLGKLSTDMTSLQVQIYLIQKEGVKFFNLVLKQVDSVASRFEVSDNDLVVAIQNYYSSLSTRIEKFYHSFCERIINTLKCFLGHR
ncbi:hypothetical protein HAX54_015866 [Datura stramonium]|uniref:Uncharacterized protein n=1 Tax=Datura stramonium TaxID=4076 RepID=A0ABS8UI22_DATST|nr:hypothetical protein [Datura stramonium]